jgi:hypothetical protein
MAEWCDGPSAKGKLLLIAGVAVMAPGAAWLGYRVGLFLGPA